MKSGIMKIHGPWGLLALLCCMTLAGCGSGSTPDSGTSGSPSKPGDPNSPNAIYELPVIW